MEAARDYKKRHSNSPSFHGFRLRKVSTNYVFKKVGEQYNQLAMKPGAHDDIYWFEIMNVPGHFVVVAENKRIGYFWVQVFKLDDNGVFEWFRQENFGELIEHGYWKDKWSATTKARAILNTFWID